MYIYSKDKTFKKAESLSDVLISNHSFPVKISVIGSGGKSSTIAKLTDEQRALERKVLSITTTHIAMPEKFGVIDATANDIKDALKHDGIAVAGNRNDEAKLSFIGDDIYHDVKDFADVILVEADGSKRLPVKFPAEWEPVILPDTDLIVVLLGLSALGKPGKDICHRWERAENVLKQAGFSDFESLTPQHLCVLLQEGYLKPLRFKYPNMPVIIALNQADDENLTDTGKNMLDDMGEDRGIVMSFLR